MTQFGTIFGIIFVVIGVKAEHSYNTYPLKHKPIVYVVDNYMFNNTIFKFKKPTYIIEYYYDTPWYICSGGQYYIECVEVIGIKK